MALCKGDLGFKNQEPVFIKVKDIFPSYTGN